MSQDGRPLVLDIQIEDVAEKGTAELRLKGAGKEMKRAG